MPEPISRRAILLVGEIFVVTSDAPSFSGSPFAAGERVTLQRVDYSYYDGINVYVFEANDGEQKSFELHDNDPIDKLTSIFATLN